MVSIRKHLKILMMILSMGVVAIPQLTPMLPQTVFAEDDDDKDDEADKKAEFLKNIQDAGYGDDFRGDLEKADTGHLQDKDFTTDWYVYYMLSPGFYMEDVTKYASVNDDDVKADNSVVTKKGDKYTICGRPNEPQNMLNHNCDIPAFMTELVQNVTRDANASGIQGQQKTPASLGVLGLGMPKSIPGGVVPVNPAERNTKYTALELFGYDLEYTTYRGEYDHIVTASDARLLANVGFWGGLKLSAEALFEGVSNVFNKFFDGWIFNPKKWGAKSPGFVDGVVATVMDTSDYNVASMHAWKRPYSSESLYNAHYLSDKEVIKKAQFDFQQYLRNNLFDEIGKDPRAKEVLYLMPGSKTFPVFKFDPHKYTEESKRAVARWKSCSKSKSNKRCGTKPTLKTVPEEEQFADWKKEDYQKDFNKRAKKHNIDCFDKAKYYKDITGCWDEPFEAYAKDTLHHDNKVSQKALENLEQRFMSNNIFADPSRGISHYICADEEGEISGTMAEWKYYYTAENTADSEFINKGCSIIRPSIEGGKLGTGNYKSTDTRYLLYKKSVQPKGRGFFGSIGNWTAKTCAKITNTLVTFAFSNIIEKLSIDKFFQTSLETFRDSIFFSFASLFAGITGIYILVKAVQLGFAAWKSIGILILVFVVGTAILFNAGNILRIVEEIPSQIDGAIAELILESDTEKGYCKTSDDQDKVRTIQCQIWDVTVFQPWVHGQWGTFYKNLNADNMKNSNSDLVGTAPVNMGGGYTEHNWALWQLSKTKTGTITTDDPKNPTGSRSRALYKAVDLQAGPNNGALSDDRYFENWAGLTNERSTAGFWAGLVGISILIIIGGLCVAKIEFTFELLFKIVWLPIVLLRGMLPNGQMKIAEYINEFVGILLKRIFIVLVLVITLNILSVISETETNYSTIGLFSMIMLVAIGLYWKELVNILNTSAATIGNMRQKAGPSNWLPKTLNMKYVQTKAMIKDGVSGAIGGAIGGTMAAKELKKAGYDVKGGAIRQGIAKGVKKGASRGSMMAYRKQRKLGFGVLQQMTQAYEQGASAGITGITKNVSDKQRSDLSMLYHTVSDKHQILNDKIEALDKKILESPNDPTLRDKRKELGAELGKTNSALKNIEKFTNNGNANSMDTWTPTGNFAIDKELYNVNFKQTIKDPSTGKKRPITPEEVADKVINNVSEFENKATEYKQKQAESPLNKYVKEPLSELKSTATDKATEMKTAVDEVVNNTILKGKNEEINEVSSLRQTIKSKMEAEDTIHDFRDKKEVEEYVEDHFGAFDKNVQKQQQENLEYVLGALEKEGNVQAKSAIKQASEIDERITPKGRILKQRAQRKKQFEDYLNEREGRDDE